MKRRDVLISLAAGLGLGIATGAWFAYLDWRLNPGGIFRGSDGTHWSFVFDTALSWLVPVFLSTFALALVLRYLYERIVRRPGK